MSRHIFNFYIHNIYQCSILCILTIYITIYEITSYFFKGTTEYFILPTVYDLIYLRGQSMISSYNIL